MQGNAPDEEHIDEHGECRHEIERLRDALRDARDYITSRITYSEVGHEGDERPVIAKINAALEQQ